MATIGYDLIVVAAEFVKRDLLELLVVVGGVTIFGGLVGGLYLLAADLLRD